LDVEPKWLVEDEFELWKTMREWFGEGESLKKPALVLVLGVVGEVVLYWHLKVEIQQLSQQVAE
jgi:hypothetical protein